MLAYGNPHSLLNRSPSLSLTWRRLSAAGFRYRATWTIADPKSTFSSILSVDEKEVDQDRNLRTSRVLSGNEANKCRFLMLLSQAPYSRIFPVPIFVPARTIIAACEMFGHTE